MLFNSKGQVVHVHHSLNTKANPGVFIPLREMKIPLEHVHDKMFRLETRAKMK